MSRLRSALLALFLAGAGSFAHVSVAHAQMSDGEKKATARAAYMAGVELQNKGQPAAALEKFVAAQGLFDAPTHLLHIAQCQALTGHLVDASETYASLVNKPLPKDAPPVFVQAQDQGKAELAQLRPRIPSMRVVVKPEPSTLQNLQITLNEKPIPNELVGLSRPVNPGPYHVTAVASGYGAAPVDVEVKEGEPKTVELTLTPGGAPVVGATTTPGATTTTTPPPYEQAKQDPSKSGPSASGFLFGVRPAYFFPNGDVSKVKKFERVGTAGPGVGLDLMVRVARMALVGGTLELASLGAPAARSIAAGNRVEGETSTWYLGVFGGILPNVDKVTFIADAGVGIRQVSRSETLTIAGTSQPKTEEEYRGFSLALNAGVSIPAGPIRIVPKAGLAFGTLSCGSGSSPTSSAVTSATLGGCSPSVEGAGHTMISLMLGLYYHLDTGKKSGS